VVVLNSCDCFPFPFAFVLHLFRPTQSDRWEWDLSPQFVGMRSAVPSLTLSQPSLREIDANDPRERRRRQVQAIVSERFTSSPRIVTSHGYCGLDALLEQQQPQQQQPPAGGSSIALSERNRPYSGREALDLAIRIAEAIADLHGFAGGVIVHGQLDLSLFRLVVKGASPDDAHGPDVQLTDVSTADFLDWDPDQQAYCSAVAPSNSVETVRIRTGWGSSRALRPPVDAFANLPNFN
jgi:hypothetical protein